MNIVIVGQGAIGLLWYHQLVKNSANNVSLVCSIRTKSAPEHTLFTTIKGHTDRKRLIRANSEDLGNADIILVCVKSYHIESAVIALIQQISDSAAIILCHNGMGVLRHLPSLIQPCYTLLTTHGSKVIKPFHARHTGLGHSDFGLISGSANIAIQGKIITTLSKALPTLMLSNNIKEKQWLKLAINCVINPISAIDNVDNGELLNDKYAISIDKLLEEITALAAYEDIIFDLNELKAQVLAVAKKTAKNCSSMRSDILQKRPTEIDYINGYIVNLAKLAHLPVPENKKLTLQIKRLTAQ
jgi:2-dehydropantoate 2-reductase